MKGDRGAFGTSGLCQAIRKEACEDRQDGCLGVSAIVISLIKSDLRNHENKLKNLIAGKRLFRQKGRKK